jgi:hypothetical protein
MNTPSGVAVTFVPGLVVTSLAATIASVDLRSDCGGAGLD